MGFHKVAYWLKSGPFFGRQSIDADQGTSPQHFLAIRRKKQILRILAKIAENRYQ
jgi:hypothetical protein